MTKSELIRQVADARGMTNTDARQTLDVFIETMASALIQDGDMRLPGLGTLRISQRKARNGVNPRTGKKMRIEAMRVVRFVPAQALRGRINA